MRPAGVERPKPRKSNTNDSIAAREMRTMRATLSALGESMHEENVGAACHVGEIIDDVEQLAAIRSLQKASTRILRCL